MTATAAVKFGDVPVAATQPLKSDQIATADHFFGPDFGLVWRPQNGELTLGVQTNLLFWGEVHRVAPGGNGFQPGQKIRVQGQGFVREICVIGCVGSAQSGLRFLELQELPWHGMPTPAPAEAGARYSSVYIDPIKKYGVRDNVTGDIVKHGMTPEQARQSAVHESANPRRR